MPKSIFLSSIIMLTGCTTAEKAEPKPTSLLPELKARHAEKLRELEWPPSKTDCDGLLWASLALIGGAKGDITIFQKAPGQWRRRPSHDCWEQGESRSQISNDQLSGLVLYAALAQRRDILSGLADYAAREAFWMGLPHDLGTTLLKPSLRCLLKVGGCIETYWPVTEDYAVHIQALNVMSELLLTNTVNGTGASNVKSNARKHPQDYMLKLVHQMASEGDYGPVISLLLSEPAPPSYVRGDSPEQFALAHWLAAANIIINQYK